MLQGHRLTLSMDGVGLDVHVKLDRNCHLDEPNMEEKRWCLGRNLTSKEMIQWISKISGWFPRQKTGFRCWHFSLGEMLDWFCSRDPMSTRSNKCVTWLQPPKRCTLMHCECVFGAWTDCTIHVSRFVTCNKLSWVAKLAYLSSHWYWCPDNLRYANHLGELQQCSPSHVVFFNVYTVNMNRWCISKVMQRCFWRKHVDK